MSTNFTKSYNAAIGSNVAINAFEIKGHDFAPMIAWMNSAAAGFAAPGTPALSSITAGALTGQGTLSVKTTYVTAKGETVASVNSTLAVADNHELVVASPAAVTGATGWNVYIGTAGSEKKQNGSAIAIGTSYTLTAAVNTGSAVGTDHQRHGCNPAPGHPTCASWRTD